MSAILHLNASDYMEGFNVSEHGRPCRSTDGTENELKHIYILVCGLVQSHNILRRGFSILPVCVTTGKL